MRKKLIAAATLLAIAAAPACAELKIYGDVDFGVHYLSLGERPNGDKVTTLRFAEGGLKDSRVGVMAKQNLDGGGSIGAVLEANFGLQGGAIIDSPSNVFPGSSMGLFTNAAFIFVEGERGRLSMGRQMTPMDDIAKLLDPADGGLGLTNDSLLSAIPGYTGRTDNSIRYSMPDMHGVEASVLYSTGNQLVNYQVPGQQSIHAGQHTSASVSYNRGPLFLGMGYANQYIPFEITGMNSAKSKSTLFGLSYDFGTFQPFMSYLKSSLNVKSSPSASYNKTADFKMYDLGFRLPVGEKGSVVANYGRLKNSMPANSNASGTLLGIGYIYRYNKSTNLYVAMTRVLNNNGMDLSIHGVELDHSALAVSSPRDFQLGMNVSF